MLLIFLNLLEFAMIRVFREMRYAQTDRRMDTLMDGQTKPQIEFATKTGLSRTTMRPSGREQRGGLGRGGGNSRGPAAVT